MNAPTPPPARASGPVPPGIVVVDKPSGMSSHDVVARVRRAFGTRKVGHAGTLDPMATGVLVVGVERATKMLGLLALETKSYSATIRLGQSTDTDDAEGNLLSSVAVSAVSEEDIAPHIAALTGTIEQVPSSVSAIKIGGKRAYQRVREGEQVEIPPRTVTIDRFDITGLTRTDEAIDVDVEVDCTSGTYIRALARDLGAALNVGGHLTKLRRTQVGPFSITDAVTLDDLGEHPRLSLDIDAALLRCFPPRQITETEAQLLTHGRWLDARGDHEVVAAVAPDGRVAALLRENGQRAAPVMVVRPAGL